MIHAPLDGTVIAEEPKNEKYILPLAPELIDFAKSGQKTTTYRYGDKYDYLQIGDAVQIQNVATKEIAATAKIVGKHWTTFRELLLNAAGHEVYQDKEHQRRIFNGYYAYTGQPIEDDSRFLVLEFELTPA